MSHSHEQFLQLLQNDYDRLERFALSLTRRRDDARELLAQSIASCLEGFDRLQNTTAFLSYAFSVISRTHARMRAQQRRHISTDPESMQELYDSSLPADDAFDLQLLYDAIDKLPEHYREVFILAEIVDLPHKEIAAIHKLSISAVKIKVFRAKALLRSLLGIEALEPKARIKKNLLNDHSRASDDIVSSRDAQALHQRHSDDSLIETRLANAKSH